jgi:phage baseplate assembly protein V
MDLVELSRLLHNLLRLGTIASVDAAAARCTVATGQLVTRPIPWLTARAGDAGTWWAPSIGEQVLLLSPGGDLDCAVALPAIVSTTHPRPDGADGAHVVHYPDGALISYDPAAHQLTATLPSGGTADITADGGVHITGDTTITGKLHVTDTTQLDATLTVDADADISGTATAQTDVVGGGISLKNHKHSGVQSGASLTGPPQ